MHLEPPGADEVDGAEDVVVAGNGGSGAGHATAGGLGRRALLVASAATLPVLLTACQGIEALGAPPSAPTDVRTLRAAIVREARLVASYTAAATAGGPSGSSGSSASPDTATAIAEVLADHRQHLARLRSRLIEPTASGSAGATAPAGAGGGANLTIGQFEQAEQAASDWLIAHLAGLPPTLAQLFASIAASEATHVPYLQSARRHR